MQKQAWSQPSGPATCPGGRTGERQRRLRAQGPWVVIGSTEAEAFGPNCPLGSTDCHASRFSGKGSDFLVCLEVRAAAGTSIGLPQPRRLPRE